MYAYIATFNGNPGSISRVRREVESGNPPPRLEGARMLMLVNLENGKSLGVRLFRERRATRRGDEALNAMPGADGRVSVKFYEVPVQTLT